MQNDGTVKFCIHYQTALQSSFPNLLSHQWCMKICTYFPLLFPDLGKTCSLFFWLVLLENYQFYWYFQRINFWLWWFSLFYIFFYSISLFFISFSMLPFNFSFFFHFFWDRIEFLPSLPFKYYMNLRLYISLQGLLWLHCKSFATLYL